jgi:Tfp pilus assembly protein PilX
MIQQTNVRPSNRRGAALVIALVLMLLVTAVSATLIRGFYTDRRERDQSQIRTQAELLRQDFSERTNILRAASSDFSGETQTLTNLSGFFDGTFQLTSSENGVIVEYYDSANKLIYTGKN